MTKRKTTPHLKRGPKPKPKQPEPPKRKVGRPATPLSIKPYRYWLAYYEALVTMTGLSRRRAAVWLEAMYKGPVTVTVDDAPSGCSRLSQEVIDLGDFTKDCESLRTLARWHAKKPADLAWLRTMSEAVKIALGPWHPEASEMVMRLAASANETEWAQQKLLPILRESELALPELADNFSPT